MTDLAELHVQVAAKSRETAQAVLFELVALDGETLPAVEAGAHIDVQVSGAQSVSTQSVAILLRHTATRGTACSQLLRRFSGNARTDKQRGYAGHQCAPQSLPTRTRGGTERVARRGIGVTPLLCMAQALGASAFFEMHYCTRSERVTAFRSQLAQSSFNDKVHHHFDDGGSEQRFDAASPVAGAYVYVCGPSGFMEWVLATARSAGWPEEQLHYEFFSAEPETEGNEEGRDR